MKKVLFAILALAMFTSCGKKKTAYYVDVDGNGTADIKYKKDGTIEDLNEEDMISVSGNKVMDKASGTSVVIDSEKALKDTYSNLETSMEKFKDNVVDGAEKIGDDMVDGVNKAGDEMKEGAEKLGDEMKEGADNLKEGAKEMGKDVKEGVDNATDNVKEGAKEMKEGAEKIMGKDDKK